MRVNISDVSVSIVQSGLLQRQAVNAQRREMRNTSC